MSDLPIPAPQQHTMQQLESLRQTSEDGGEYWMARDIQSTLGYPRWEAFEAVISRSIDALVSNGQSPSHHLRETTRMMGRGNGARKAQRDFFLSRAACYLIAMNGDPNKPQIGAAQAYFASQARRAELLDAMIADAKRLELRDKVTGSAKRVSSAAKSAGVQSSRQGIFHEQRFLGLYEASSAAVKRAKGLKGGEQLFDRAGPLELSAHDFQMNLAADIIEKERVKGEQRAFEKNLQVAKHVRKTIRESGGTLPENLPLVEHIKEVRKRVTGKKTKALPKPKGS